MRESLHILSAEAIAQTANSIVDSQSASGQIAWFPDGQTDPWDHVEAAMALDVAGRHDEAQRAYDWLRTTQNPDGSWFREYRGPDVSDAVRESNFSAYLAVGLLHHVRTTGDTGFLRRLWPSVTAAMNFVLGLQTPGGEVLWARGLHGTAAGEALLTGCSSMYHALRCALALAELVGEPQPDWELSTAMLGHAVSAHPDRFAPRDRYSMDWYYPVLGGALRGPAAHRRLDAGWDTFVVPGLGIRCVSDRPWVTGAETCELVLALCALGDQQRATQLFADVQHLRHEDGSYWTGYVYPDDAMWPVERTTWTAGAVLLAAAVLHGEPVTTGVFVGSELPAGQLPIDCDCDIRAA